MRAPTTALGVALVLGLALAGASRGDDEQPASRPSSQPAEKGSGLPALGHPAGVFGAGVQQGSGAAVTLPQLKKQVASLHGRPVRTAGRLQDVCRKKGCWMVLVDHGVEVRVRFKDYSFFVPRDAAGREAIVEGIATETEIPEDLARHYAEEGGDPEAAKKIKGPQKVLAFTATGVEILGKRTLPPRADAAAGSAAEQQLAARLAGGRELAPAAARAPKQPLTLRAALQLLRELPGARTVEFSLCTELSRDGARWMVFGSSERPFQHGFAVREDARVVGF
ncbi:MAG: DUF4920 domain-containing protein [Planctomycetota bacterium]